MVEAGLVDGQPGLPVGGCQTCVGLHLAGLHLLDGGLVDGVLQEALPGHGAGFAVPHSFRAAAGLHWGDVRGWSCFTVLILCLEIICAMFDIVL